MTINLKQIQESKRLEEALKNNYSTRYVLPERKLKTAEENYQEFKKKSYRF